MKVFQIHFSYDASADDALFYYGSDYPKLFTCKEYAEKVAKEKMEADGEEFFYDYPIDYTIIEREVDTTTL